VGHFAFALTLKILKNRYKKLLRNRTRADPCVTEYAIDDKKPELFWGRIRATTSFDFWIWGVGNAAPIVSRSPVARAPILNKNTLEIHQ